MTDPIKSCHAYSVPKGMPWPVTLHGLLYDREYFLISTATGRALSQKQYPRMALITPTINLETRIMFVSSPASPARLEIPLDMKLGSALANGTLSLRKDARVCADTIQSLVFTSQNIQDFFSAIVGVDCSLALYHPISSESMRFFKPHLPGNMSASTPASDPLTTKREIWLSNESPFLLISQSSVDALSQATPQKTEISPAVFRPNFVLEGNRAYSEDSFHQIRIGDVSFDILGQCRRCHMVCVDPERGVKETQGNDVYLGLGKTRKNNTGGVVFGIHMGLNGVTQGFVKVGDPVIVEEFN
jgi:molybdenum cofactor sulfurtransferase